MPKKVSSDLLSTAHRGDVRSHADTAAWARTAYLYARADAVEEAPTHTVGNLDLELVEDLLDGLHVGL